MRNKIKLNIMNRKLPNKSIKSNKEFRLQNLLKLIIEMVPPPGFRILLMNNQTKDLKIRQWDINHKNTFSKINNKTNNP